MPAQKAVPVPQIFVSSTFSTERPSGAQSIELAVKVLGWNDLELHRFHRLKRARRKWQNAKSIFAR